MAKKSTTKKTGETGKKYDRQHLRNIASIQNEIKKEFEDAVKTAARLGATVSEADLSPDTAFSFSSHPTISKRADKLLSGLETGLSTAIVNGIRSAWTLANNKNDEISRQVFGDNVGKLSKAQYNRYFSTNGTALDAFLERRTNGLSLSDRVWKYTDGFKNEIEMGLEVGIRNGLSADEMSRDLRQWLQNPDMLFRRIRDEYGDLQLSRRAAAYHPGQGVYRSSYMNARRLAATETNIAYHTADYERWQELDFVVGIHVILSGNHTCLGSDGKAHPFEDICDELSGKDENDTRGRYPKDFKFTGWHPHCRCTAISILKTDEEIAADTQRILNGEEVSTESVNTVTELPEEFADWVTNNQERIERTNSLPYFLADNTSLLSSGKYGYSGSKLGRQATREALEAMADHTEKHSYSDAQKSNFESISKATGYQRGKPMTFAEADKGRSNVYKDMENCASCVLTHEMRLRGYNITAKVFNQTDGSVSQQLSNDTRLAWLTTKGKTPEFTAELGGTAKEITTALNKQTQAVGSRYHLGWDVTEDIGHIITVERTKKGLVFYDPQKNNFLSLGEILEDMKVGTKLQLLRVDRLLVNPQLLKSLTTSLT